MLVGDAGIELVPRSVFTSLQHQIRLQKVVELLNQGSCLRCHKSSNKMMQISCEDNMPGQGENNNALAFSIQLINTQNSRSAYSALLSLIEAVGV